MGNNTLILGLQWGDEGKGKIVDALAESSEAVCRFQGGHNAGHTLKVDGEQKVLHLVPSGILHPSVHCVLGNGLVLSLPALAEEIKGLQDSGINFKDRFYVSEDCALILPTHIAIDKVRDKEEGIGTTGRGIGPAYEDKIARRAIRFGDLNNLEIHQLQIKLAKELAKVGKPIVLILNQGRPRLITDIEGLMNGIINIYLPLKVKSYVDENLAKEVDHFKTKYKLDFNVNADNNMVIPEFKIDLLNKNKKILKTIEHIEKIEKNFVKNNFKRKNFIKKNFKNRSQKINKFRKKFNYQSRNNNIDRKKIVNN